MDLQAIKPGQSNTVYATVLAVADNTPITSGTVNFYLYMTEGDYAGYYYDGSNSSWSSTKASAGEATHIDDGLWSLAIAAGAWPDYDSKYILRFEEDGNLHLPDSGQVIPSATGAVAATTYPGGVTQIANEALALVGMVAHNVNDYIENINDTDDEAAKKMARQWASVRDHVIIELAPPEVTFYATPGAELDEDDQNTFSDDWTYVYSKPDNCLSFRGVYGVTRDAAGDQISYQYEEVGDQIGCNYDDDTVVFKYIKLVADTTKWSRELKNVMGHYWAYLCARPMGATAEARAALRAEYERALFVARGNVGKRVYIKDERGRPDTVHRTSIRRQAYGRPL